MGVMAQTHNDIEGAKGLAPFHLAARLSLQKPVVLVTTTNDEAEDALRNVRFLLGDEHAAQILFLPSDERGPYHATSLDPLITMERMATLQKLATGFNFRILVTSVDALCKKTVPFAALQKATESLEFNSDIDRASLLEKLEICGYSRVNTVEDTGTYAVRGSIIDIFWPGEKYPCRVDLFGNTIERLYSFDPSTQRVVTHLQAFTFGAVKDVQLSSETIELATTHLRDLADEVEYPTKKLGEKLSDLQNEIAFFGIESLVPAFYDTIETPLAIVQRALGSHAVTVCLLDPAGVHHQVSSLWKDYDDRYAAALVRGELCFPPGRFLTSKEELETELTTQEALRFHTFAAGTEPVTHIDSDVTDDLRQDILKQSMRTDEEDEKSEHHLLAPLADRIKSLRSQGLLVLLPVLSLGGTQRLRELLQPYRLNIRSLQVQPNMLDEKLPSLFADPSVHAYTYVAKPDTPAHGGILRYAGVAVLCEDDVFGKKSRRKGQTGKQKGFKTSLSDLSDGDPIVHVDHGLGLFKGLTKLNVRGVEHDYLLLVYAGNDKLYLPVHRVNMIQAYSGAETGTLRLDKLGGSNWQTKKKKVKEAVMAMAQDLLNLYAKRELAKRPVFSAPDASYWEFEARFPFETTVDQQKAIDEVIADLQKERPMDRLICGDVGYGKTEVAMRAAMLTVMSGRQVVVLAPTTILAQQHGINFTERFKESGAQVAIVSRFQKPSDVKESLKKLKDGKVDVLIGTHRVLSDDVSFKNLGLVVVDEEQRFGIKDKERLKRLRAQVDVLTMSATPIPRTLQMGFFGIRDLSIIETPPVDRRAIRTSIIRFDDEVIREGIMREISRGGQVYFVHNRVSSIAGTADYLRRLVPEAKIEIGHGQMDEKQLEDVMVRFMKHDFNVLVCTTIIETGIDVSSANTMFIDNADDFGLAQLYQLRGRVGRSKERAFAYLVVPSSLESLTPIARKRLEILHRFSELGAGFKIAQHDLELRGAGDLLGSNQHGHIAAVGYDLYVDLLKEAVEDLRGKTHEDTFDPDVNLPMSALIPDKYIADLHDRMGFYQRFATASDDSEVLDVIGSLGDQFGDPPVEVLNLADVMVMKHKLRRMKARALEAIDAVGDKMPQVIISLGENAALNPTKLTAWIKKEPQRLVLTPKMKLIYTADVVEWERGANKNLLGLCKQALDRVLENAQ
jgi:transcription-repair coupling factor (superfamily II helicase)